MATTETGKGHKGLSPVNIRQSSTSGAANPAYSSWNVCMVHLQRCYMITEYFYQIATKFTLYDKWILLVMCVHLCDMKRASLAS